MQKPHAKNLYRKVDTTGEVEAVQHNAGARGYFKTVESAPVVDGDGLVKNAKQIKDYTIQRALELLEREVGCLMDIVHFESDQFVKIDVHGNQYLVLLVSILAKPLPGQTPKHSVKRDYSQSQ